MYLIFSSFLSDSLGDKEIVYAPDSRFGDFCQKDRMVPACWIRKVPSLAKGHATTRRQSKAGRSSGDEGIWLAGQ